MNFYPRQIKIWDISSAVCDFQTQLFNWMYFTILIVECNAICSIEDTARSDVLGVVYEFSTY